MALYHCLVPVGSLDPDTRTALAEAITAIRPSSAFHRFLVLITGHQSHQIFLALNEVDPSSSMQAGMILPSFGEESMWTRQHNRELEELHRRRESTR
jgi:hypothetical protein